MKSINECINELKSLGWRSTTVDPSDNTPYPSDWIVFTRIVPPDKVPFGCTAIELLQISSVGVLTIGYMQTITAKENGSHEWMNVPAYLTSFELKLVTLIVIQKGW